MAMPRRNRERPPGRRKPFRDQKPVILVLCEGEKTERQYIEGFRRACRNPRVDIEIARDHGGPKTLVELAKEFKKDNIRDYDSIWCVFDVDDHPNIPEALRMARDNRIHIAISNPHFELWLLLHFRDQPGMQHRDKVTELLKKFVPGYHKHVDYGKYADGYEQAVIRSQRLDQQNASDTEVPRNPSTRVYRLTESIRQDRLDPSIEASP